MNLAITKHAVKFLESLDAKQYRQVGKAVMSLMSDPRPSDSAKLKDGDGDFRLDVGEYRIIYAINGQTLDVHLIGKRNGGEIYEQYKEFKRGQYKETKRGK